MSLKQALALRKWIREVNQLGETPALVVAADFGTEVSRGA